MFGNIVIVLLVSVVGAWAMSAPEYQLERLEEYFEDFKREYNKVYPNEHEESKRLEIFKQNLIKVNARNKMRVNDVEAVFGITKFSDLTAEEFKNMRKGLTRDMMPKIDGNIFKPSGGFVAPESFDWRTQNKVTGVKNQGDHCGSCYAFSAVGCLESQYAIKYNKLVDFSEQQVVDCVRQCKGCSGGLPEWVFDQLKTDGLELDSDYPYVAQQTTCQLDNSKAVVRVSSYIFINGTEDEMKEALVEKGPLSIVIDSTDWHSNYNGGILISCSYQVNDNLHAVLIVGYGEEQGVPYWIVKNSWGGNWGENGYIRIKYGINACGVTSHVLVADIQ